MGQRTRRYRSKMLVRRLPPPDRWTKSCASSPEMRVERSTLWQTRRVLPYRLFVTGLQKSSKAYERLTAAVERHRPPDWYRSRNGGGFRQAKQRFSPPFPLYNNSQ